MYWLAAIVMVIITNLDDTQNKMNVSGEEVNTTRPATGKSDYTCQHLSNFSVLAIYKEQSASIGFISLNISWAKTSEDMKASRIEILPDDHECSFEDQIFNHGLQDNVIITPQSVSSRDILPDCNYKIEMKYSNTTCMVQYHIPECVGRLCNCTKYRPLSKILHIRKEADDIYVVEWDPGKNSPNNHSYEIRDISFSFSEKNENMKDRDAESALVIKQDLNKQQSKIRMQLLEGKNYTISAEFKSNFSCVETTYMDYTESVSVKSPCKVLSDIRVKHIYSEADNRILLNISWDKPRQPGEKTMGIYVVPENGNINWAQCFYEDHIFNHPLQDNVIITPTYVTEHEINPDCDYRINFEFADLSACNMSYKLPECVRKKCNCYKFEPNPIILDVYHYFEDVFIIQWDSGKKTPNNSSYIITNITFYITAENEALNQEGEVTILEQYWSKQASKVHMKLFPGENYTLNGTFWDDFFCDKEVSYNFTGPATGKSDFKCPNISNISVLAIYQEHSPSIGFISLNISWAKPFEDILVSRIEILSNDHQQCSFEHQEFDHPLENNVFITPDSVTTIGILPDCEYKIEMKYLNANCTFPYRVPECVGRICNCAKYGPHPKILDIEKVSEDVYIAKWDPGIKSSNNYSYEISTISFDFCEKNQPLQDKSVRIVKQDFNKHQSVISMKLFQGEAYTISAYFQNNFSCVEVISIDYTVPTSNSNQYLIFFLIVAAVMLVALKHDFVIKMVKRVLTSARRRHATTYQESVAGLTRLHYTNIPMRTNIQYNLVQSTDKYEFPPDKLKLKDKIGSGAFGHVFLAKAEEIGDIEGYRMVAVKTLGMEENVTKESTEDFIAEIEIFKKIGEHPNIVTLLGCCTIGIPKMMIMEFVPCGDLKNYLLELRQHWLKNKNKRVFFPDTSDGSSNETATPKTPVSCFTPSPSTSRVTYPHRSGSQSDTSDGAYIEPAQSKTPVSATSSRLPSTSETVFTFLEDPETPGLTCYARALDRILDHTELQYFACQIAKGMAHLEKIPVTHRDLAARNILISEHRILKISDFGLSRTGPYINQKGKKLPLRWMALEAIAEHKYDSKSDVWSFGVVLWEIGTLGAFPYEKIPDSMVHHYLQVGHRLQRPEICTDELYTLMKQCWVTNPDDRPSFQDLVEVLDINKRKVYVNFSQLNPTYVFPPSEINHFEHTMQMAQISLQT